MRPVRWIALLAAVTCACGGADPTAPDSGDDSPFARCEPTDAPVPGRLCFAKDDGYRCCPTDSDEPLPDGGETVCFYPSDAAAVGEGPAAEAWFSLEARPEGETVHVRVAFAPWFVDNTYGEHASAGWGDDGHTFRELVGSDHVALDFADAGGAPVLAVKLDYLSEDDASASGYRNLGPFGGDGKLEEGPDDAIVATMTSLDRNLNERGCVLTESSPGPGVCPEWDTQVVYEAWLRRDSFASGFGAVGLASVHASPSMTGENTVEVVPQECPPSSIE